MEAWELWNATKTQWRTSMMGANGFISPIPIGLDYTAIHLVAKTLDIEMTPATFYKVQALEFYERNRKPREGETDGCE